MGEFENSKYYFDEKAANAAVRFIETYCRHISGKWASPRGLDGRPQDTRIKLADWQKDEIIRPLFGWKKKSDNSRRYTTLYVEIPKKNGKSALSACIMLLFLYMDREPGSELYIACPVSKDQAASLLLEPARAMIEKDELLSSKAKIMGTKNYTKSILVGEAFLKALTREAAASEGVKPQAAFIDETHVFKDSGVIENLEKSMIIRTQPLVCYTTTAGDDMGGVGYQKSQYYKDVRAGKIEDESALVVIYGADPDDDPFDEATWRKANPMWDISINQEQFRKEAAKARESASSLNSFKRYHLNIWTNATTAWIGDHEWQESQWEVKESLRGHECYLGLDLGLKSDTSSLCAQFWDGDKCISKNWFFLPEVQGHESMKDRIHYYDQFVADGFIEVTPGSVRDDDAIIAKILELASEYDIKLIGYDPWQSTSIMSQLVKRGIDERLIEPVRSGAKTLTEPTDTLERMVRLRKFNHLGNPVLRWMAGNVKIRHDGDNKYPEKGKERNKIDGIMANLYALFCKMEVDKTNEGGSYLEHSQVELG